METLTLQERIEFLQEDKEAIQDVVNDLTKISELDRCTEAVENLSALAVYPGGHAMVMRSLTAWQAGAETQQLARLMIGRFLAICVGHYMIDSSRTKSHLGRRYRFEALVEQLAAVNDLRHRTSLLTLVNCLLTACPSNQSRRRLRNELVGANFTTTIERIKSESNGLERVELVRELDRFEQMKLLEEEQMTGPDGVDLNSHEDIFYAVLKQVSATAHEALFLNILQHLLQVDSKQAISDHIWVAAETFISRIRLIESAEEADKLIRIHTNSFPMLDKLRSEGRCHCSCHKDTSNGLPPPVSPSVPPPAPPLPGKIPPAAPPLPPPVTTPPKSLPFAQQLSLKSRSLQKSADEPKPSAIPNITLSPDTPTVNGAPQIAVDPVLPQQFIPAPKAKLKTFAWNKVPAAKVMTNGDNVWLKTANRMGSNGFSLDFERLEELFSQSSPPSTLERKASVASSPDQPPTRLEKRRKESQQVINLLDPKRSLNVNIFLKQFRGAVSQLLELIRQCNGSDIGLEKLRGLQRILPEMDEIEAMNSYSGDISRLGGAEQFFMSLIQVPDYKLRIDCMLLRQEFASAVDYVKPALDAIILAAQDLKNCRLLQEVLYLVLMVGNYLNSGSYGGNAAGFKMTSLWKLVEIKANKSNMTLLHFVVMEAQTKNPHLLEFPKQVKFLEDASKLSVDSIKGDVRNLKDKTERISGQLAQHSDDFFTDMKDFVELAQSELKTMNQDLDEIDRLRRELASFFCEDVQTFKLEECFKIFHFFCQQFTKAIEENAARRMNEIKAEERRQQQQADSKRRRESLDLEFSLGRKHSAADLSNGCLSPSVDSSSSLRQSASLMDILEQDSQSSELVDNAGKSAFARRSVRRRSVAMLNGNERERQVDGVLMRDRTPALARGTRTRLSLDLGAQTAPPAGNIDKPQESNSVLMRTRLIERDKNRIYSTADLRSLAERPEPVEESTTSKTPNETIGADRNLERWRAERDRRSSQLIAGTVESAVKSVDDLSGLLETLEAEKREHEIVTRGRKYKWRESGRENPSPPQTTSPTATDEFVSWRDRVKQEMPDYDKYTKGKPEVDENANVRTDIDEIVRHCEKTRQEIDQMGVVPSNAWQVRSVRDSGIEDNNLGTSPPRTEQTNPTFTEESNLSVAVNATDSFEKSSSKEESSSDGEQWKSVTDTDSPVLSSPSTSSNSGSAADHDEGFETESQSTVCSAVPELSAETSSPKPNAAANRKPNYLDGTKASSARNTPAKAPVRPVANQSKPGRVPAPRSGTATAAAGSSKSTVARTKSSPTNNNGRRPNAAAKKCPRGEENSNKTPLQTSSSNSSVRTKVSGTASNSGSVRSVRSTPKPSPPPSNVGTSPKPATQKTTASVNTVIRGQIAKMRLRIADPRGSSGNVPTESSLAAKRPSAPIATRTTAPVPRAASTGSAKRWERLWSPPKPPRNAAPLNSSRATSAFRSVENSRAQTTAKTRVWR